MTDKDRQDNFADSSPEETPARDPRTEETGDLGLSDEFTPDSENQANDEVKGWRDSFTQEWTEETPTPEPNESVDPFATGVIDSRELTEEAPEPSPDIWLDHDSSELASNDDVLHTGRISIPGEKPAPESPEEEPFSTQPYRLDDIFDRVATEPSSVTDSNPTEEISGGLVAKTMMQYTQELPFNLRPAQPVAESPVSSDTGGRASQEMPRRRAFSAGTILGSLLILIFFLIPWKSGWDINEYVDSSVSSGSIDPPPSLSLRSGTQWYQSDGELFFTASSYLWKYDPQNGFLRSNHLDPTLETALSRKTFNVVARPPFAAGYRIAYVAPTTDGRGAILKIVDLDFTPESTTTSGGISREYSAVLADDHPSGDYSAPVMVFTLGSEPGPWIFLNEAGSTLRTFTFKGQEIRPLASVQLTDQRSSEAVFPAQPLVYHDFDSNQNLIESHLIVQSADSVIDLKIPDSLGSLPDSLKPIRKPLTGQVSKLALAPDLDMDWDLVVGSGNRIEWLALDNGQFKQVREVSIPTQGESNIIGLIPSPSGDSLFAILDDSAWIIGAATQNQPVHRLETEAFTNNRSDRANYLPLSSIASTQLGPGRIPQMLGIQGKGEFWIYDANQHAELVSGEWNVEVASPLAWTLSANKLRCDFASENGTVYFYEFRLGHSVPIEGERRIPPPPQIMSRLTSSSNGGSR